MTWGAFLQKFNFFQLGRASKNARRPERLNAPGGFLKGALLARPAIENALQTDAPPFKNAFGGHGPLRELFNSSWNVHPFREFVQ